MASTSFMYNLYSSVSKSFTIFKISQLYSILISYNIFSNEVKENHTILPVSWLMFIYSGSDKYSYKLSFCYDCYNNLTPMLSCTPFLWNAHTTRKKGCTKWIVLCYLINSYCLKKICFTTGSIWVFNKCTTLRDTSRDTTLLSKILFDTECLQQFK